MRKLERGLILLYTIVLLGAYAFWMLTLPAEDAFSMAALITSALCCLMIGFLGAYTISAFLGSCHGQIEVDLDKGLGKRSLRRGNRHPVVWLILWLALARMAVYAFAYVTYTAENGYHGGMLDTLSIWLRRDAPQYMDIAKNWYAAGGEARFNMVLLPLYPICVRIMNHVVENLFTSGMLVSFLCTLLSGWLLYELAMLDLDKAAALRAVKFQMFLPAAFLFCAPMNDGLFFALSIGCMLLARKKQYALACFLGGLAAFTALPGILLLVPVLAEIGGDAFCRKMQTGKPIRYFLARLPALLLIPAGLGLYIYINYSVSGDAFAFLSYQEELGRRIGFFFHTAAWQADNLLDNIVVNQPMVIGQWLPNLLFLFGAPLAILSTQRPRKAEPSFQSGAGKDIANSTIPPHDPLRQPYTMRASYLCYFLVYYILSVGVAGQLSAPRLLTACFPLAIALASKTRPRLATLGLYGALLAMQVVYIYAYVTGWPV